MMPQEKLDLQPLDIQPLSISPLTDTDSERTVLGMPPADKSFLGSVWDTISSPLIDAPSRWARDFSNWITTPKLDESRPWAMTKGFIGGATEGVGDVISSLTS